MRYVYPSRPRRTTGERSENCGYIIANDFLDKPRGYPLVAVRREVGSVAHSASEAAESAGGDRLKMVVQEVSIMDAFTDAFNSSRYAECRDLILKAEAIDEEQMRCGIVSSREVQTNIVYQLLALPLRIKSSSRYASDAQGFVLKELVGRIESGRSDDSPDATDSSFSIGDAACADSDLFVFILQHLPRCCPCLCCKYAKSRIQSGEVFACLAPLQGSKLLETVLEKVRRSTGLLPCVEALLSDDWAGSGRFCRETIGRLNAEDMEEWVRNGSSIFSNVARQLLKRGVDPNLLWSHGIPRDHLGLMLEMSDPLLPSSQRFRAEAFYCWDSAVSILHLMLRLYQPTTTAGSSSQEDTDLETYATAEQIDRMMAILHGVIGVEATTAILAMQERYCGSGRADSRGQSSLPALAMCGLLTPTSPLWPLLVSPATIENILTYFPKTANSGYGVVLTRHSSSEARPTARRMSKLVRMLVSAGVSGDAIVSQLGTCMRKDIMASWNSSYYSTDSSFNTCLMDREFLTVLLDAGADAMALYELVVSVYLLRSYDERGSGFEGSSERDFEDILVFMWGESGTGPNTPLPCRQMIGQSSTDWDHLPLLHLALLHNSSRLMCFIAAYNARRSRALVDDAGTVAGFRRADVDSAADSPSSTPSDYLRCMAARRERLLAMGCYDTSAVDAKGRTALHVAVLLCLGAPLSTAGSTGSHDGQTWHIAALRELIREVSALRQRSTPHSQRGHHHPRDPALLPGLECDLTAKDDDGNTPYDLVLQSIESCTRGTRASTTPSPQGEGSNHVWVGDATTEVNRTIAKSIAYYRDIGDILLAAATSRGVPLGLMPHCAPQPKSTVPDSNKVASQQMELAARLKVLEAQNEHLRKLLRASGIEDSGSPDE